MSHPRPAIKGQRASRRRRRRDTAARHDAGDLAQSAQLPPKTSTCQASVGSGYFRPRWPRREGEPHGRRCDGRDWHRHLRGVPQALDRRDRPRCRRRGHHGLAATPARSSRASATRTGRARHGLDLESVRPTATRSKPASKSSSPGSTSSSDTRLAALRRAQPRRLLAAFRRRRRVVRLHPQRRSVLAAALARADGRILASSSGAHLWSTQNWSRSTGSPRSASTTRSTSPVPLTEQRVREADVVVVMKPTAASAHVDQLIRPGST